MQGTSKGDNKLWNMISQSLEQFQSLNWKNLGKKRAQASISIVQL